MELYDEALQDLKFLLDRYVRTSPFDNVEEVGMSSQSLVAIAYGIKQEHIDLPWDNADLNRCINTFKKLPAHRVIPSVVQAIKNAVMAVRTRNWSSEELNDVGKLGKISADVEMYVKSLRGDLHE